MVYYPHKLKVKDGKRKTQPQRNGPPIRIAGGVRLILEYALMLGMEAIPPH